MSRISDLITALCPNGIPFKRMGDIGTFYGGLSGKSKEDFEDGNAVFISYMNVYSNIELQTDVADRVRVSENERQNTVQYGDVLFTGSSETPDECGMSSVLTTHSDQKLYLNSFCFGYRFHDPEMLLPGFTKHLFRSTELRTQITKTASGVTRFNVSKKRMEDVIIPVPPTEIQREIVQVLDSFTKLEVELSKELVLRQQMFNGYSRKLFDSVRSSAPTREIWQICNVTKGSSPIQKTIPGQYPMVVTTSERKTSNTYQFDNEAVCIPLVSSRGHGVASLNHVYYQEGKFALGNILCALIPMESSELIAKYLYYYFEESKDYTLVPLMKGGANVALRIDDIVKVKIPVPSIEVQRRIVETLDAFDEMCNSKSSGLPAEIDARRQQYAYYRDKLLAFEVQ